jgi:hypothetical protein
VCRWWEPGRRTGRRRRPLPYLPWCCVQSSSLVVVGITSGDDLVGQIGGVDFVQECPGIPRFRDSDYGDLAGFRGGEVEGAEEASEGTGDLLHATGQLLEEVFRALAVVGPVEEEGEPEQDLGGDGSPRGGGVIVDVARAGDELFVVGRGVVEGAPLLVPEELGDSAHEGVGLDEPARLEGGLVDRDEPVRDHRVVLQVTVEPRPPVLVRAVDATVSLHVLHDEGRVSYGGLAVVFAAGHARGEGEGAEHEAVPGGEDLLVASRPYALFSGGEEPAPNLPDSFPQLLGCEPEFFGDGLGRAGDVQYVLTLEVAPLRHVPVARREVRLLRVEDGFQILGRPDVELAFHALRVGVFGGVEAALLARHVAQDIVEGLLGDAAVEVVPGGLVRLQVEAGEEGVIVEHLLEVRDEPVGVHGVAGETAAQLVVDAAVGHLPERQLHAVEGGAVASAVMVAEQDLQVHGLGEFGGRPEPAEAAVQLREERPGRTIQQPGARVFGLGHGCRTRCPEEVADGVGALQHLIAAVLVGVGDAQEQLLEGGQAVRGDGREVGTAVERGPVRGEEHRHRPATVAGEGLDSGHVDGVYVRSLFAVHLYVHEVLVHHARRLAVLERLALHYVAPVAGAVANGEQYGTVFIARAPERLLTPGVPVDRIVFVLEQVRARLVRQPVGHAISPSLPLRWALPR